MSNMFAAYRESWDTWPGQTVNGASVKSTNQLALRSHQWITPSQLSLSPPMVHTRHSQEASDEPWGQIEYTDNEGTTIFQCSGKGTFIIDGYKDRKRRHVMNMSKAKVGCPVYRCGVPPRRASRDTLPRRASRRAAVARRAPRDQL